MRPIDADAFERAIKKGLREHSEDEFLCQILEWFLDNIKSRPTIAQPTWISVDEKLPQEDEPPCTLCDIVQVLLKDGYVTVGFCNRFMRMWFYLPKIGIEFVNDSFDQTPVIAWQPLSQPPKGG